MDLNRKTALVTLTLNISLTILKFIAYIFSGSLAILAEAWHSFADIITSTAVLFSTFSKNKANKPVNVNPIADSNNIKINFLKKIIFKIKKVSLESKIAIVIGCFLLIVSLLLFYKVIYFKEAILIKNSLLTGIIFIIFSMGSYLISNFEILVGKKTKNVALISDGMHARSDMAASLLTGFSLILYYINFNIDRFIAFLIAGLILILAIETIINVILFETRKKDEDNKNIFDYKIANFINYIFTFKNWQSLFRKLDKKFSSKLSNSIIIKFISNYPKTLLIIIILIVLSTTSTYKINYNEQGLIERFGQLTNRKPIQPGLHIKFPWPIDKVKIKKTEYVKTLNIGNTPNKNTMALLWTMEHGSDIPFLSGDRNFFFPYFTINYKINNLYKFLYQNINPEKLLTEIANSIITKIFVNKNFYAIVTDKRKIIENSIKEKIQSDLEKLNCGIEILFVNMKDVHPPIFIADAFENVIAAMQEKEKMINEAIGYKNNSIPIAEGDGEVTIKKAEAYKIKKIKTAEGTLNRYKNKTEAMAKAKNIILKKYYYDYIKDALKYHKKIIVDPNSGVPEIWLNKENFFAK